MLDYSDNNHDSVATTLLPCKAVLFDCDGVLVDSEAIILNSWGRWAREVGVDPDIVLATVHGRRSQDTVAQFVEPRYRKEALALIDSMEIEDAAGVRPFPEPVASSTRFPKSAGPSSRQVRRNSPAHD